MSFHAGFHGYRGVLPGSFEKSINNMVDVVAVNDDRFGNKFGSGPLRFKLYETGACQAMLLDETMPDWKTKIFRENVFLSDLLKASVSLTGPERDHCLARAKSEYKYDEAYRNKLQFQSDGKKKIDDALNSILKTEGTLVRISYEGFVDRIGLGGFTPFGVTQVTKQSAIYDLVPIRVIFKEGVELQMKQVIPVLIDKEKKMVVFAVAAPVPEQNPSGDNAIETADFRLSFSKADITREGHAIDIRLK